MVLELAERVQGAAGEPAGFRAAVTALRGALDQVGRAAFLTLVARSEETADTVVDEAGTVHRFKQAAAKDWLTLWSRWWWCGGSFRRIGVAGVGCRWMSAVVWSIAS